MPNYIGLFACNEPRTGVTLYPSAIGRDLEGVRWGVWQEVLSVIHDEDDPVPWSDLGFDVHIFDADTLETVDWVNGDEPHWCRREPDEPLSIDPVPWDEYGVDEHGTRRIGSGWRTHTPVFQELVQEEDN